MPTAEKLTLANLDPEILIPGRLIHLVDNPMQIKVERFSAWQGRLDQEFQPPLALNITDHGIPVITFIAHEPFPEVMEVVRYEEAEWLRFQGLGRAFYENLETILKNGEYKILFGKNSGINLGFFLKMGRYSLDQVDLRVCPLLQKVVAYFEQYRGGTRHATVKFLDPELEKECIKPEVF